MCSEPATVANENLSLRGSVTLIGPAGNVPTVNNGPTLRFGPKEV